MGKKTKGAKSSNSEFYSYASGAIGSNVAFALVLSFLMPFFNSILGISSIVIGTIFLVSRLIDAITDPLMGMITDATRSKWGRYRPYVLFGAPLLGISVMMLFSTPGFNTGAALDSMSMGTKLIWAYVMYITYSLVSTLVNIPFHALTPVMSKDIHDRNRLNSIKNVFSNIAIVAVSAFTLPLIKAFSTLPNPLEAYGVMPGDALPEAVALAIGRAPGSIWSNDYLLMDPIAWQKIGVIFGIIVTISFILSAYGARKRDNIEAIQAENLKKVSFKDNISMIKNNRILLLVMVALGTDVLAFAGANALNMYYWQYIVGDTSYITIISLVGCVGVIPVIAMTPMLMKKFGKRNVLSAGTIASGLILLGIFLMPMPTQVENSARLTSIIVVMFILQTVAGALPGVVCWAMLPDAVEYGEWKTGVRGEGVISSSLTFINKLGMALGGFTAGVFLGLVGFVMPIDGIAQIQTTETLRGINIIRFLLPLIGYAATLVAMYYYDLDNAKLENIMKETAERRAMNNGIEEGEEEGEALNPTFA